MSEEMIYINDYLSFNTTNGWFELSHKAQEILYRKKHVICSYSGCTEWGHMFFCELLNLYSGQSIYNFALGTTDFKDEIEQLYRIGHSQEVIAWVNRHKNEIWFCKAAAMLRTIIDDVEEY